MNRAFSTAIYVRTISPGRCPRLELIRAFGAQDGPKVARLQSSGRNDADNNKTGTLEILVSFGVLAGYLRFVSDWRRLESKQSAQRCCLDRQGPARDRRTCHG